MAVLNIVLLLGLCGLAVAKIATISHCDEISADHCEVTQARVEPCKKPDKCVFLRSENATISFDFTPNFAAEKLKTAVYWASWMDLHFDSFGSPDACLYTTCPSEPGKTQTLSYTVDIEPFPQGIYPLKWKVWNEANDKEVCCFQLKIQIKGNKKRRT